MHMFRRKSGMALVIVLAISMSLLILGTAYIGTFTQSRKTNTRVLEQLQADFFAQGVAKIAMLKFKKFPADFYHAYKYDVAKKKGTAGLPALAVDPLASFHGAVGTVLQKDANLPAPLKVDSYSTMYRLTTSKDYDRDVIEIEVNVHIGEYVQTYVSTVDASRTVFVGP